MFPTSAVFIMLTNAAIPTFFTVLIVIQGTFSQNQLFYHSGKNCHRFIPPTITSALGLCTYPCLLLSNAQPPKILVFSEPDGTACKIYNGFLQTLQVGNCQAGFCQRTPDYGAAKRMKRDVTTSVSSSQSNSSASQKQLSSRRGSDKPKSSKRDRIEQRRRQMWTRCDCASMRGLFIDISYSVSGLRLGRRGKRGRRRKVGCRVICFFLINKYKHDPKWAGLFEARFSTAGSGKLANATGALPGGKRGDENTSTNQTGITTNGISGAGPNPVSSIVRGNVSGSIGSAGTGLKNNQTSGPPAPGPLNVTPVNKAGGGVGGGSNTSAGTGPTAVGSASTSINGGTWTIPPITSSTARGESSNITGGGTFGNNSGAGYPSNGGANVGTSPAPVENTLPSGIPGTAGTSSKPVTTATTAGVVAIGEPSGGNPQNSGSRNGPIVNAQASAAGGAGVSTGRLSVSGNPKNESVGGLSSISAGGASSGTTTGAAIGRGSGAHPQNVVLSTTGLSTVPSQITATSTVSTTSGNGTGRHSGNINGNPLENTRPSNNTSGSSNQQGTHGSGISSVGSGLSEEAGTGSLGNNGNDNNSGSLVNGTNAPLKPKVESDTRPSTITSGGTGSGGSNPVGNETGSSGALGASAGGLLRQQGAGSPTNTVAGAPQNGGGLSTATSSSVSGVGTSSDGSGTNISTTNVHVEDVTSSAHTTATGGNPSINGIGTNTSSRSGASAINTGLSSGGGSFSGEGAANGISSTVGVVSGAAPESSVSSAHPSGERIGHSLSSGRAGVGTAPEATGIPVTGGGLSGASTAPTIVNSGTTAGIDGTVPTGSGGAGGTSTGGATAIISTEQPNESTHNSIPEAASAGSRIGMGSRYGAGFGNSAAYGAGALPGNHMPFNFGGTYGGGASSFGSIGSGISSGPWSPPGGAFNRISAGYGNTGRFGNMPGTQPFGGAGGYASNGRFSGDIGIYEDDIFFQD